MLCWRPSGRCGSETVVWRKMIWTKFARNFVILGFFVSLLAACTMGLGIANVAITWYFYCMAPDFCPDSSSPYAVPINLTWVASGIWASIAVFITGIMANRLVRDPCRRAPCFFVVALITAILFIPAMIIITSVQVCFVVSKGMWPGDNWNFILPIILIALAAIEFILVIALIVYLCASRKMLCEETWEPIQDCDKKLDITCHENKCYIGDSAYYYPSRIYEVPDKCKYPRCHPQPVHVCNPDKKPARTAFPDYKGAPVSEHNGPCSGRCVYDAKNAQWHPKD